MDGKQALRLIDAALKSKSDISFDVKDWSAEETERIYQRVIDNGAQSPFSSVYANLSIANGRLSLTQKKKEMVAFLSLDFLSGFTLGVGVTFVAALFHWGPLSGPRK